MQTHAASLRMAGLPDAAARYDVEVLSWAEVGDHGVSYVNGRRRETLQWASVLRALAAEVGEPEGVRTVVFDLVVETKERSCAVCRFDAEPGAEAQETAMYIASSLGHERCSPTLLALARDGEPSRQVPDLDTLAEEALAELGLY
jgi:hypothetical protein